jgi:hypothetical protein
VMDADPVARMCAFDLLIRDCARPSDRHSGCRASPKN